MTNGATLSALFGIGAVAFNTEDQLVAREHLSDRSGVLPIHVSHTKC